MPCENTVLHCIKSTFDFMILLSLSLAFSIYLQFVRCVATTFSMAYGTEYGLVVVDIVQKICLLNIASPDLYGAQDPYARTPRSPKRTEAGNTRDEQARSPSIDQVCTIFSTLSFSLYIHFFT